MQPHGRDRLELASLDFLGDAGELRARALEKLRGMGGRPQPRDHYEGSDKSGSVVVTIDPDKFVKDVAVRSDWRDSIPADGFAWALFEAYVAAIAESAEFAALAALAADEASQREADPQDPPPPVEDFQVWRARVWDSLHAIGDTLHRTDQAARDHARQQERTVSGPHGYLQIKVRGKGITGITGDPQRIKMAETYQLRAEALDAFRAARGEMG